MPATAVERERQKKLATKSKIHTFRSIGSPRSIEPKREDRPMIVRQLDGRRPLGCSLSLFLFFFSLQLLRNRLAPTAVMKQPPAISSKELTGLDDQRRATVCV